MFDRRLIESFVPKKYAIIVPINVPIEPTRNAFSSVPVLLKHFCKSASRSRRGTARGTNIWSFDS